ncbi:helix-turn-helix domain-containing protein [Escherichia coli]|nr:helix-turn-helix domain-containing protein [Escherichia coli]EGJ5016654.1 helix-turn-helix domain-containing protein [Escherichia coli]EGJ6437548.1 helix-turn-helix domain-containing protein [Escherichia coli]
MLKTITVNAIVEYIENNLELMHINTDALVEYSGYSKRYLQILFSSIIGIPVGKYIQMRRITRAAILLRFTNLSIADISERFFYDSQQTFTREFKKNSGYTPLQYRKSKLWSFKNMLSCKKTNHSIPAPAFRRLEQKNFYGEKIFYKDIIPSNNPLSTLKWSTVDSYLSKDNNPIYISHKLEEDKKDKENMHFNAVFWNNEDSYNSREELTEGIYACFSFTGSRNNYRTFIYNIYMNTLPFYGLQRKDSYDLEIIKKLGSNIYQFEYFLPVICDDEIYKNNEHNHDEASSVQTLMKKSI